MRVKNDFSYYFIYLSKNMLTSKCYIGWHATNNLNDGYMGSGKMLKRSIKKNGEEKFITGILEFGKKENILEKEIYWISKLNTISPNGYNLTGGGDGGNTYELLSEQEKLEFRKKSSENNKGRKRTQETKDKISESNNGVTRNKGILKSNDHKEKLSNAWEKRKIEYPVSNETKEKHRQNQLGKNHSNETKEKIGIANSNRIWKEESKEKISKANKGSKRSKETIEKMKKKYKCIYCGKEMNKSNLSRYHNDNCKLK